MGYDDINLKQKPLNYRKDTTKITEYLVGEHESFHLNQFSEGEIYLKEIKFGLKQSKNDILGFETPREGEELEFGGSLLCKIQLLRDEEDTLDDVMTSCS